MSTEIALSKILKYRKGRATSRTPSLTAERFPVLTPEYLRGNELPEFAPADGTSVFVGDKQIILLWDGSNAGEFFLSKRGLLASTMVAFDVSTDDTDTDYLYYDLKQFEQVLKSQTRGSGIPHVDKGILLDHKIRLPERHYQSLIVTILSTIDRAIEQTEALIAKYQRVKTGLMHDLLTYGIDKHGQLRNPSMHEFKDSPHGLVPAEWKECKLTNLSYKITSGSRGWAAFYAEEGAKFIRIGNLTREHINLRLDKIRFVRPPVSSEGQRTALEVGDLLISITADLGIIGVVPEGLGEAYINQHIALVRLNQDKVNPCWLGNFLAGFTSQRIFSRLNESGAKAGLNLPTVSSLPIVLPDKEEQDRIANVLRMVDEVILDQNSQFAKLQRLKTGLMRDLLTGRVLLTPLSSEPYEVKP